MANKLKKSLADALEIPDEVALGAARIVITGQRLLTVENHKGIVEYTPEKIAFQTNQGRAEVLGEGLTLAALSLEELSIEGAIMALAFARGEES